jgi:hypothetical protein
MTMFAGLDVGFKRTAVCVVDGGRVFGRELWTPIRRRLQRRCIGGVPSSRSRAGERADLALACSEAWRIGLSDSLPGRASGGGCGESRRVKSDKADAYALAEMLWTGWYSAVHVKGENSHRLKALLEARDQLVRAKRARQPNARGATAVRHQVAVAPGHKEVRRGGTSGSATRCSPML